MDIKSLPDYDLVLYTLNHDREAFRELVARYEGQVLLYSSALVGNELSGIEVAQEAFLETFKQLNLVTSSFSFKLLLFRNTNRVVLLYLKKHGARHVSEDESFLEELLNIDNTDREFKEVDFLKEVKRNIHKLPFPLRDVLLLHFLLNFNANEISDILMLPVNVIDVRLSEARAKIILVNEKK